MTAASGHTAAQSDTPHPGTAHPGTAHPRSGRTDGLGVLPEPYGLLLGPAGDRPPEIDRALAAPTVERIHRAIEVTGPPSPETLWRAVLSVWLAYLTADPGPFDTALKELAGVLADTAAPLEHGAAALLLRGVLAGERATAAEQAGRDLRMAVELYDAATCYRESAVARLALARQLMVSGAPARARSELDRALTMLSPDADATEFAVVAAGAARIRLATADNDADRAAAVELYRRALRLQNTIRPLPRAWIEAGLGVALLATSADGREPATLLRRALGVVDPPGAVLPPGLAADAALLYLNLGIALQTMPGALPSAIGSYHRALRVFTRDDHPQEYALIHGNLATAYLSGADGTERDALRHALAVQSYEEALRVYTAEEHPAEYAMVQNNLANALQYLPSAHPIDNLDRAIRAYRAALEIRTRQTAPLEHARTQANLGVALRNFPAADRAEVLGDARAAFATALEIFRARGCDAEAEIVTQELRDVTAELSLLSESSAGEPETRGEPG